jgi:hypothetical protein
MKKRIEFDEQMNVTNDLIVKPNASLYDKDRKQENIFISLPVGEESKLIQNEESNPQDTLDETVDTFASPSVNGTLTTPALSIHETEDRDRTEEGNEVDLEVSKSSPGRSSMAKSVHSSGFRLPPIDMNSNSFKLTKVATPAVPVMMVNPVLAYQPAHKPTPPTSPMPIDYSPTISPASSNESLFDNKKMKNYISNDILLKQPKVPKSPKNPNSIMRGVAYSSLARKLFPLNSEFMTFLAKEGLHQDWQIYTLNNRSIEAFLYKYMIFISDSDREQFLTGIMLTRILIQIHARDAESSIEAARSRQTNISMTSVDTSLAQEAWSVSRTCPIGFGSFSPRRDLLLDFDTIVPNIKHLLLSRGICGLTHLEQMYAQPEKAEDLVNQAEQLILSGDITVGGLDSLLRLLDGISQDAAMLEFVKAQEDWEIDGGNAVEPRVVKRPIRTAISVLKSNTASRGLYYFNQTNTKTDMSMRRKFDVAAIGLGSRQY